MPPRSAGLAPEGSGEVGARLSSLLKSLAGPAAHLTVGLKRAYMPPTPKE